jgi:hypothetical protein
VIVLGAMLDAPGMSEGWGTRRYCAHQITNVSNLIGARGVSTRFCKPRAHPRWRAVKSISPNLVSTNWHATSHGVTIEALLCWWFVARVIALSILPVHELTATALRRGRVGSVRSPTLDRGSPVVYGIGGS